MIQQAQSLIEALEANDSEENLDVAIDVIKKYGSYRKAMQQVLKIEFKKKDALLFALLGTEDEDIDNELTLRAKTLINGVEHINAIMWEEAQKRGLIFEDLVKDWSFTNITEDTMAILNQVKPYTDHRQLIINIRRYQTSVEAIKAFKNAIIYKDKNIIALESPIKNLRIKQ